jgi:membrane associated rhomboid family serine protease
VASLAYLAFGGPLPCVGASGAIAGLMGWVLVAAPWLELRFFFFLLPYASRSYELPVAWLLVPWIGMQLLVGWAGASGSVAISAHVGGFAAGAAAAAVMRSRWCVGTPWFIDPRPPTDGAAVVDRLHRARAAGAIKR